MHNFICNNTTNCMKSDRNYANRRNVMNNFIYSKYPRRNSMYKGGKAETGFLRNDIRSANVTSLGYFADKVQVGAMTRSWPSIHSTVLMLYTRFNRKIEIFFNPKLWNSFVGFFTEFILVFSFLNEWLNSFLFDANHNEWTNVHTY